MKELGVDVKKFFDHMGEVLGAEYKNILKVKKSEPKLKNFRKENLTQI